MQFFDYIVFLCLCLIPGFLTDICTKDIATSHVSDPSKISQVPMATPELKRSPQGKLLVATCSWNLHGRRCWDEADVLQGTSVRLLRIFGKN